MAVFSVNKAAFTPSLTADNWLFRAGGSSSWGKVVAIGWGGRHNASAAYRTRWCRATTAGSSASVLTAQKHSPGSVANTVFVYGPAFVTDSTLPADPENLFAADWNVHGGSGMVFLDSNNPWVLNGFAAGTPGISCRNTQGTDANASNYWVMWEE